MVAHLQAARRTRSGRCCACRRGSGRAVGCCEYRGNTGRVPSALGPDAPEARAEIGALSDAWLRAGRCHAGVAAWTQREPDWAKVEAEGGRACEEAKEFSEVAERRFFNFKLNEPRQPQIKER